MSVPSVKKLGADDPYHLFPKPTIWDRMSLTRSGTNICATQDQTLRRENQQPGKTLAKNGECQFPGWEGHPRKVTAFIVENLSIQGFY